MKLNSMIAGFFAFRLKTKRKFLISVFSGIMFFLFFHGGVKAQFIGADFHYEVKNTNPLDTLPISMADPGMLLHPGNAGISVKYDVKLKLYFNCFQEDFHQQQPVTIHEHVASIQTADLNLDLDSVSIVKDYITVACETANEQCLKVAYYSGEIELMNLDGGYDLTWGTCCWGLSVTNLDNLKMQGLAMVLHLPSIDGQLSNSTPVFNSLPRILTCPDKIMHINSSAVDRDGDKLSYRLIHPYGFEQEQNFGAVQHDDLFPGQETNKPLVVGRPPFKELSYSEGYSADNPLAAAGLVLGGDSGSLEIHPGESGSFLIGIGVSEYRNDILLGETQRVFLLEVIPDPITNITR